MNDDLNSPDKVICPTLGCGAVLPVAHVGGVTLLHATFPDDLKQVSYFLKTGVDRVYCSQCGQFAEANQLTALCFVSPVRTWYFYIPQKLAEDYPDTVREIQKQFETVTSDLHGVRLELVHDPHQFQKQLAASISRLVAPILASFVAASQVTEGLERWQEQYLDKLDRVFFAGAHLITDGAIPFYYFIASDEETFNRPDIQEKLSSFGPFHIRIIAEDSDFDQEQLQELVRDYVRKILVLRVLPLARQLVKDAQLNTIEKTIGDLLPPEIIDKRTIEYLSKTISYYESRDDVVAHYKYAYQASLAAICDLAKVDNPNQEDWAGWYVALELHRRQGENLDEFDGLVVPSELASRTITPEQIWDQFALRAKEGLKSEGFKQLQYWSDLAEELGIEKWSVWLANNLFFDLESASEEAIEAGNGIFSEMAIQDPATSRPLIRSWLQNLATHDIGQMITFGSRLRQQMFTNEEADAGIWITCRMSQILNERMLYRLAKQQVERCIDDLRSMELWPPSPTGTFIALLTEEGNCLRYTGDPLAALERYELCRQLLPSDLSDSDVRVNERNVAIALREAGRWSESLSLLGKIYPYAETAGERADVLTSIGVAQQRLGQSHRARQSFGHALAILPKGKGADSDRLLPLLTNASAAGQDGDSELALEYAFNALEIAQREGNLWLQAVAVGLGARFADDIVEDEEQKSQVTDLAVQILQPVVNIPTVLRPPPTWDIGLRSLLAERLEAQGKLTEAEYLLEQTIRDYAGTMCDDYWKLHAKLAEYAQRRGDNLLARSHLLEARRIVRSTVARVEAAMDPIGFMFDKDRLQQLMADAFLSAYQAKEIDAEDLRIIADFQSSVVLSERLWSHKAQKDVNGLDDHTQYNQAQLAHFVHPGDSPDSQREIAVVQVIDTTSGLYLLLTRLSHDYLSSHVIPLALDRRTVLNLIDHISFRLAMWSPARKGDPLANVADWNEFTTSLRTSLNNLIRPGTHLCVIPGPLSGLPLHLALGEDYPLNYVPSLLIMRLLRQQRLGMHGGIDWRPSSVHDFVVWRVGEHPDVIEHFRQASRELEQAIEAKGIRYTYTGDIDGTADNLFRALQSSECVRLSCHGRACVDDARFELLVAADGQLPPQDTIALDSESGQRFLIDWQDFDEITGSSPIVFSTACASGMAISLRGGERVGLERYLLRSGTMSYVAPQWPVPVAQIQSLINQIITSYASATNRTLSQVVFDVVNKAVANGMPGWIARSVAIHGEWL